MTLTASAIPFITDLDPDNAGLFALRHMSRARGPTTASLDQCHPVMKTPITLLHFNHDFFYHPSPMRNQMKSDKNSVVAIFESHGQAEDAIRELQKNGFDMKKLSIVGKDYHTEEHVVGYYNTGDRMKYWGKLGAFWGGFWGLLFGSAFFWIPGIGQILVAGPLVMWIVGALEGAVVTGGITALGAGLYSIGIPKNRSCNMRPR